MPWAPTTTDLLDLSGVRRRADRFRFELWQQGFLAGTLTPDAARPPTVKVDTSRAAVRTLESFYLPAGQMHDIDTVADRVRVVHVLQNGAEFSLGWFMWGDDSRPRRGWGSERSSTLVDEGHRLDVGIDRTIGFGAGVDVLLVAIYMALLVIPSERISYELTDATLTAPVSWPPGTNQVRIMTELMAGIGYLPPFFDRDNILHFRPLPDVSDPAFEPALSYDTPRVLADSVVESDDLLDAPNRYIVYDSSGQGGGIVGHYDIPSSAPFSIAARDGVVVPRIEAQQGIGTPAAAAKAAKALAMRDGVAYRWASWQSPADPRHDVWDPVALLGRPYLEPAWSISCRSGGVMTHTAKQVAWPP
ncbi:MAG TPA: hypothetical protein VGW74_09255 [Propionibacteriaceae bacterium]|nr:hypothetical protein [Propionibacteriaceae bacterium]